MIDISRTLGANKWIGVLATLGVGYLVYRELVEAWWILIAIALLMFSFGREGGDFEYNLIPKRLAQKYALKDMYKDIKNGHFGFKQSEFHKVDVRVLDGQTKLRTENGKPQYWEVVTRIDPLGITCLQHVYPFVEPQHMQGFIMGAGVKKYGHNVWSQDIKKTNDVLREEKAV